MRTQSSIAAGCGASSRSGACLPSFSPSARWWRQALRAPGSGLLGAGSAGAIARVTITGLIRSDEERVEALARLEKSAAPAVIVHINSPGGTTAGSEQLHSSLMRLREKKPLV